MANWNISSNAADTIVRGLPAGVDNDQGTLRHAGNIRATTKFSNVSLGQPSYVITVVSGVNNTGILSGGTFNNNAQAIIRRISTDLAGVSNTEMRSGASNSSNRTESIKQMRVLQTRYIKTAIRNNKWNEYSGAWDNGFPQVANSGGWNIVTSKDNSVNLKTSGTDNAANPSQSVPGEFAYHYGSGGKPTTDEYQQKTLW